MSDAPPSSFAPAAKAGVNDRRTATARAVQALRRELTSGAWSAGDRLPSEPDLAQQLGVSRVSVRSGLAQLQSEGLISRRHGSGTFVNSVRPLVTSLHRNVGSDQLIRSRGREPGIVGMAWTQIAADDDVATHLNIESGTPVINIHRVRTSDGIPVTLELDYFAASLLPEAGVTLGPSLYGFLSNVCGIDVTFGIATLEPAKIGAEFAQVLEVDPDELCLIIRQVDYDDVERPVCYSVEGTSRVPSTSSSCARGRTYPPRARDSRPALPPDERACVLPRSSGHAAP